MFLKSYKGFKVNFCPFLFKSIYLPSKSKAEDHEGNSFFNISIILFKPSSFDFNSDEIKALNELDNL